MATWLIIEPTFSGHHFTYLFEIIRGALARNIRVIVGVGDDAQGEEIARRISSGFPGAAISIVRVQLPDSQSRTRGTLELMKSEYRWWKFLSQTYKAVVRSNSIDFVFVPYLDRALFAISLFGSPFLDTAFAGITLRQRFHLAAMGVTAARGKSEGVRRWLFLRLLRTRELRSVHVIDDTLEAYVRRNHPYVAHKVCFMPDPSEPVEGFPREKAREALRLPINVTLILAYGHIDARKGISRLLTWIAGPSVDQCVHILLAGTLAKDVESLMTTRAATSLLAQHRLWLMNRYIDPKDESLIFSATDLVWLGYEKVELMSGVLVKAAQFRKAILFENYGLIGRYAKRFGSTEVVATSVGLGTLSLPEGIEMRSFAADGSAADSLRDHSWENACRTIFDESAP